MPAAECSCCWRLRVIQRSRWARVARFRRSRNAGGAARPTRRGAPDNRPRIDRALDNHYVWLDTTGPDEPQALRVPARHGPETLDFPARPARGGAARLPRHRPDVPHCRGAGESVPDHPDPSACYQNSRLEIIDGIDRNGVVDVNLANSIDNRLTKLLQYLARQHPDEGWDRFLLRGQPSGRGSPSVVTPRAAGTRR